MPVEWNLPTTAPQWGVQDVERFSRMPFWMAKQTVEQLPYWTRWSGIFPKIKWQANMGDILQGVVQEYSPITQQIAKPNYITSTALKTVVSHFERTNQGRIYWQKFESPLFHWLPSFRDFAKNQIGFANSDITRQIGVYQDNFVRWQALQLAPAVYVVGQASPYTTGVPVGPPGEGVLADPKDAAFFQTMAANIGTAGYLDFKNIVNVRSIARFVAGLVPWDGAPSAPSENKIMNGKWVLMGEGGLYESLSFDTHVLNTRPLEMDLLHKEWSGVISENSLVREERYPLRFDSTGTFVAPEIEQELPANATITSGSSTVTNPGGAARRIEVIPNPAYVNAPYGIAWFIGNEPLETIDVGPPPSEFTSAKLDTTRLSKLNWNGEVRLTDNLLINYGGASGVSIDNLDTNKYGEFLQLFAAVTFGVIPKKMRNIIPIIYRRNNQPALSATS